MNFLIVVDMQNDFISGSLGSAHAAAIVPNVVKKVSSFDGTVIYTRDTHGADYMHTQEGEKLPVVHCTKDTPGWEICDELKPYVQTIVDKPTEYGISNRRAFVIRTWRGGTDHCFAPGVSCTCG